MATNDILVKFLSANYLGCILLVVSLVKIFPSEWTGFWKYNNNRPEDGIAPRISLLKLILHNFVDAVWGTATINIVVFLKESIVSVIIFGALGFDILVRSQISKEVITLICIGIVFYYLELLIKTGNYIRLFGGLIEWRSHDNFEPLPNPKQKINIRKVNKTINISPDK